MHNKFDLERAIEEVINATNILIIGHVNPDGDALGSGLSLYRGIKKINKNVSIIMPNEFPEFLNWLPSISDIKLYSQNKDEVESYFEEVELIISVDHNSPERVGDLELFVRNSKARKLLFDHHINPEYEAYDTVIQTTQISSTSEIIFHFLHSFNKIEIDKEIATCIYTGMMTDTGSFSYACHTPDTYFIGGKLQEMGADIEYIHQQVYFNYAENRMRLLGYSLSNKLVVIPEYKTAYIHLSINELDRFNYQAGDTEGLVNWALSLKGIHFAALFKQRQGKIRISFRSIGDFSVNEFSSKYFSGGGHKHAAGGSSKDSLKNTIKYFESLLPELNI